MNISCFFLMRFCNTILVFKILSGYIVEDPKDKNIKLMIVTLYLSHDLQKKKKHYSFIFHFIQLEEKNRNRPLQPHKYAIFKMLIL